MLLFLDQLRWEFVKFWARPRSWIGFGACLVFELAASALYRLPGVRLSVAHAVWRSHGFVDPAAFSGLSVAVHLMGESMKFLGILSLVFAGAELWGYEEERGIMRAILCRPVSSGSVFVQKIIVAASYTLVLSFVIAATSLAAGLLFHGRGPLFLLAQEENIIGTLEPAVALHRYLLAMWLMAAGAFTCTLLALALSCFRIKPIPVAALALTLLLADNIIRSENMLSFAQPYCVTTRLLAWRQVFNNEVSWLKMRREYGDLIVLDGALLALGFCGIRSRQFRRPLS